MILRNGGIDVKNKHIINLIASAIVFSSLGAGAGYLYTSSVYQDNPNIIAQDEPLIEDFQEEAQNANIQEDKITPSTKIVYRYYYTDDQVMEEQEEVPPYFLLDLTLEDMLKYYSTWEIVSFSAKEVIMQKTVYGPSHQRYVVGEKDGYIAVFYEEEIEGISLKEVTEIPINGLSEEDLFRLSEGIKVIGKDALARTLENYSS